MKKRIVSLVAVFCLILSFAQLSAFSADAVSAKKAALAILVDGTEIKIDGYNIAGNNFFKLRDVAYILSGSETQFNVTWDKAKNTVVILTGEPYAAVGGEMASATGDSVRKAVPTASKITIDGTEVQFIAYNIGGNNYFKLRDLGEKLDFGVYWNQATTTVELYSDEHYSMDTDSQYSAYITSKDKALNYLSARLAEGCPIASYETTDVYVKNAAFSYDNALSAMAFISNGRKSAAKEILDAFITAIASDRYQSDRIRNAYMKGDPTALPGWWQNQWCEDAYQVGTNVGNSAYVALAMLQYYHRWGGDAYLNCAKTIMGWVIGNCSDSTAGFTAGYDGWPENNAATTYTYKSTEHNIDAYAAFHALYAITGDTKYKEASEKALAFVLSMYDANSGRFYIGTDNDGVTPRTANIVLDAQAWAALALGGDFTPYADSFTTILSMKTIEGGYPFSKANTNGGYWCEGTAFTALVFREFGMDDESTAAFNALIKVQLAGGGFPAATVNSLYTGESWTYSTDPHIAPAAWFIMAVNRFNPYKF